MENGIDVCQAERGIKMKHWVKMYQNILMLTQFGLSFITPLLLCLALCWWLCSRFSIGGWIYIPGFFFGLGGSFTVAYKFYVITMNQQKKEKKKERISFNRHI